MTKGNLFQLKDGEEMLMIAEKEDFDFAPLPNLATYCKERHLPAKTY